MTSSNVSGVIADRFGVRRPLIVCSLLVITGFLLLGGSWLIAGSIAIVLARGGLGTLFPAAVAHFASEGVLQPLARNQTWRDIGAAAGPIATGILLEIYSPQEMQLALAAIYAVFFIWLMMSPIWRGERP